MSKPLRHHALLQAERSVLLIVDVQEAFRRYVEGFDELAANVRLLGQAAALQGVPVVVTEQYPSGLGPTVAEIDEVLVPMSPRLDKVSFDALAAPGWVQLPDDVRARPQWVVAGIEAHVCVRQTALALLAAGHDVHAPVDAIASRTRQHADIALQGLAQQGVHPATVEQVVFDWLGEAGTPEFRGVQALLREQQARHAAGR